MGRGARISKRSEQQRRAQRRAQLLGAVGFAAAALLPAVLWHRAIGLVASDFRLELDYLVTGWSGYGLMLAGLAFLVPVVVSIGQGPDSRLYVHSRNAYLGWGVTLYLLGCLLAVQVAQIASGTTSGS